MHRDARHDMEAAFMFVNQLTVTDAQKAKFAELKREYEPKFFQIQKMFADTAHLGRAITAVGRLNAEFEARIEAVLTAEQKRQLQAIKDNLDHRAAGRRAAGEFHRRAGDRSHGRWPRGGHAEALPPVNFPMADLRWQFLPGEVASAAVSPDQRIWYMMSEASLGQVPPATIRAVAEREFDKPAPQLQGVRRVFFEAAGSQGGERLKLKRVWLVCGMCCELLLGYDGRTWIERQAKNARFYDDPFQSGVFFQLNDAIAVLDSKGCHVMKGKNWIFQDLSTGTTEKPRVWPDADGKGLWS